MKLLQTPNLKTFVLTKVIYTAICGNDEQAFDNMSEESEKNKKLYHEEIVAACSKSRKVWLNRPKHMVASAPSEVPQETP